MHAQKVIVNNVLYGIMDCSLAKWRRNVRRNRCVLILMAGLYYTFPAKQVRPVSNVKPARSSHEVVFN